MTLALLWPALAIGQVAPNEIENIDFLVTFGKNAETSWGDDDFVQIYFFSIPENHNQPFYLRIFDPEIGGKWDEIKGIPDTQVKFSFMGGEGVYSEPDAQSFQLKPNYNSGSVLSTKTFDNSGTYDDKWYVMGPFSPLQGEYIEREKAYYFKMVAEGISGDDGNLYKYSLSLRPDANVEAPGANAFTYSYTFRLPDDPARVSHIYPFVNENVVSITIHNFDFDHGGQAYLYSVSKNRHPVRVGGENEWETSEHKIDPEEANSTIDIQIVNSGIPNNNIVIYITNEYNQPVPFYTVPIGGPPKFKYDVTLNYIKSP